jgi:heterodisulfide reductase subunit A-like polyferredoxin
LGFIDGENGYVEKDFDLVVLAVGLDPKSRVTEAISKLGIKMNEYGFALPTG